MVAAGEEREAGLELSAQEETVRAAGGVVSRRRPGGVLEVLLVHRSRYDDWTIPKGKLEPDETHEQAAHREVLEETGVDCELGRELPSTSYRDRKGRPKTVRYWAMRPLAGEPVPSREVDELRWASLDEAGRLLTHQHDADVLRGFAAGEP